MSAETIIWVAVALAALVAVLALGYLIATQQRRHRLKERFGPEYERTVRERDSRKEAEQELLAREERHAHLDIRPLDDDARRRYSDKWTEIQERFVDAPGYAVTEADHLVTAVMTDRGYPTDGATEQLMADLSVEHGGTLGHYRQAHEISGRAARQEATTEELRQAMVHYRALFEELLTESSRSARSPRSSRASGYQDADGHTADHAADHAAGRHNRGG